MKMTSPAVSSTRRPDQAQGNSGAKELSQVDWYNRDRLCLGREWSRLQQCEARSGGNTPKSVTQPNRLDFGLDVRTYVICILSDSCPACLSFSL
ncbi:hypothetical protein FIBSPDRAFT_851794 [Athelia psychrophila]|uniref:Uncharacterized protein n=1 Tax=Athelia psychrophila TaxID=1759441 RepID=A0A166SEW2_9AGAM|nr:hypothetical protein FIBSPDRAFT_851794 [Fibularhizoctonia sp. CBS 109695]